MPVVTFRMRNGQERRVEVEPSATLYDAAQQAGVPLASSCSANFMCGKCNVQILEGEEGLAKRTPMEEDLLMREGHAATDRIGCRVMVQIDCVVTTRYW